MKKILLGTALSAVCFLSVNSSYAEHTELAENHVSIDGREYIRYDDMLVPYQPYSTMAEFDNTVDKWTNGEVFYSFDSAVTDENRQRFLEATKVWSSIANVSFIERVDQVNYVYITNSTSNTATVGMVGGRQSLTMHEWSQKYVIVHELGHTLGMWHEQQRTDRDAYVDIHMENVKDGQSHNFNIKDTTIYSTYDFLSVMHYSSNAFSKNGQMTIVPKPQYSEYTTHMGIRSHISSGDQLSMATRYGAKNIQFGDLNFKNYLVTNFDSNGDGEIDSIEAATIKEIHTPGNGNINNVEGVEFLTGLLVLDVSNENLTSSPSLPHALKQIDLSNNQLQSVDASWAFPLMMQEINISGNPIDEYACEDIEFLKSSVSSDNVFYSPVADGTELVCNAESKFILANGKPKLDRRSKGSQTYNITVPEGATNLVIETANFNDSMGGEMNVYVAFNRQPSTADFDFSSTNNGNVELIETTEPAAGVWYILLEPVDRSFENVNLMASFNSEPIVQTDYLINGQIVTGISADKGDEVTYVLEVPNNATNLSFSMSGGSGDADLYVRFAEKPTASLYDCRPWMVGNIETCTIDNVQAGLYYITLKAFEAFSDVSLVANYDDNSITGGEFTQSNLAANAGYWLDIALEIPAGMTSLEVQITGGVGDADLYVRYGLKPTDSQFDCRPYLYGSEEVCTIANPAAGVWYLSTKAYQSFSGLSLIAKWAP